MELRVVAKGNYPKGTEVQHVCFWQNNGTDRIKAARFVEKAARSNYQWRRVLNVSFKAFLDGKSNSLMPAISRIAADIGKAVNRIDTGQLKTSMEPEIIE